MEINRFTREEGEKVRHFTGLRCYCTNGEGQPDPNCKDHENGGWLYADEKIITGLVTDIAQHREFTETGVFFPGDCVFSPASYDMVSEGDKIIFTWPLPFGQGDPLVRGGGRYDTLYYEAVKLLFCIDENKVRYYQNADFIFDGKKILWTWLESLTLIYTGAGTAATVTIGDNLTTVCTGATADNLNLDLSAFATMQDLVDAINATGKYTATVLLEGSPANLTPVTAQNIKSIYTATSQLPGAKKPASGIRYTIKYMAFIEWIAYGPPTPRISHGRDFGAKVPLRKKHLVNP